MPSSDAARARMVANRSRDTKPELLLRSELHRRGLRFYVDRPPLEGMRRRADILFTRLLIAVYVDGCFWHGCPIHGTWPKANADFWKQKIQTNQRRDADTNAVLRQADWTIIRVWEHDDVCAAADQVESVVVMARSLLRRSVAKGVEMGNERASNDLTESDRNGVADETSKDVEPDGSIVRDKSIARRKCL